MNRSERKPFHIGNKYSLKAEIIILLLFILSLVLFLPAIDLLGHTLLPFLYVLLIPVAGTLVAWLCLYRTSPYNLWWTLFLSFVMGSALSLFLMLYINRAFPKKAATWESFEVIRSGERINHLFRYQSNCDMPYLTIIINGRRKNLELTCDDKESLESFERVECNFSVGFFGWPYVYEYVPKKWGQP